MKRIWAIVLAMSALAIFVRCGTSPAQEEEGADARAATQAQALTQEETFSFPLPGLPADAQAQGEPGTAFAGAPQGAVTTTTAGKTVPVTESAAGKTNPTNTATQAGNTKSSTTMTTTTAAAKTTTTITTTAAKVSSSTTTTTTTTAKIIKIPQSWDVSLARIQQLGLNGVSKTVTTKNSFGTVKSYAVAGPRLRDVLQALGADMAAINSGSVLTVVCTDPVNGAAATYHYTLIMHNDSIFDLGGEDAPRLFAAVEPGKNDGYSDSSKAVKHVDRLTLNYNRPQFKHERKQSS